MEGVTQEKGTKRTTNEVWGEERRQDGRKCAIIYDLIKIK
jgi:hypothetical protein